MCEAFKISDALCCAVVQAGYYPGYEGYEGYYDPNVYQGYTAQPTAQVPPPQPPSGPPPETAQTATTQPETAPGAETEEKDETKEADETIQVLPQNTPASVLSQMLDKFLDGLDSRACMHSMSEADQRITCRIAICFSPAHILNLSISCRGLLQRKRRGKGLRKSG